MSTVAYQATIPYLLEQNDPTRTWTLCTRASGDNGSRAAVNMTGGALFPSERDMPRQRGYEYPSQRDLSRLVRDGR
jgi:hypothetical protein